MTRTEELRQKLGITDKPEKKPRRWAAGRVSMSNHELAAELRPGTPPLTREAVAQSIFVDEAAAAPVRWESRFERVVELIFSEDGPILRRLSDDVI